MRQQLKATIGNKCLFYILSCITFINKHFKGIFLNKQEPQNAKQIGVLLNTSSAEFCLGTIKNLLKGGILFVLAGRQRELNQNDEISPLNGENWQTCLEDRTIYGTFLFIEYIGKVFRYFIL